MSSKKFLNGLRHDDFKVWRTRNTQLHEDVWFRETELRLSLQNSSAVRLGWARKVRMAQLWLPHSRPVVSGEAVVLLGLFFAGAGLWLAVLEGTWYYAIAGLGLIATGVLLIAGRRLALGTAAPVRNEVNPNRMPFPFNIRLAMVFWNALNFAPGPVSTEPSKVFGMESRRPSDRGRSTLRHLSQAKDDARRRQDRWLCVPKTRSVVSQNGTPSLAGRTASRRTPQRISMLICRISTRSSA